MTKAGILLKLVIVLMAVAPPVHSGGYWEGEHYHDVSNGNMTTGERMTTETQTRNLVSGLSFSALLNISLNYQLAGDVPTYIVDYRANQTAEENVYYSRLRSNVTETTYKDGEDPVVREVNAESYIIMPKKFDANQAINVHFSEEENGSVAEVLATFTYDGETYEFSIGSGINESETLHLYLYPYCPLFEGLDLDYENTYIDPVGGDDFDYEGSFVMQALQTEGGR